MSEEKRESKGYWLESEPTGAELLCFRGKWDGKRTEKKVDLAALMVERVKRNPKLAAYFKRLLES